MNIMEEVSKLKSKLELVCFPLYSTLRIDEQEKIFPPLKKKSKKMCNFNKYC